MTIAEMAERLLKMWNWLVANEDDPRFVERENAFLVALAEYEAMCDAWGVAA